MSLEKETNTKWEWTFPIGDDNESFTIEITKDGIIIGYDLLTWEEIDKARMVVTL